MVKLSPAATDVRAIARRIAEGGADAISASTRCPAWPSIGMRRKPLLGNVYGGLSRAGTQARRAARRVRGRAGGEDPDRGDRRHRLARRRARLPDLPAPSAVQVGTAVFADPVLPLRLVDELAEWCAAQATPRTTTSSARPCRQAGQQRTVRDRVPRVKGVSPSRASRRGALRRVRGASRGPLQAQERSPWGSLHRKVPGPAVSRCGRRAVRRFAAIVRDGEPHAVDVVVGPTTGGVILAYGTRVGSGFAASSPKRSPMRLAPPDASFGVAFSSNPASGCCSSTTWSPPAPPCRQCCHRSRPADAQLLRPDRGHRRSFRGHANGGISDEWP